MIERVKSSAVENKRKGKRDRVGWISSSVEKKLKGKIDRVSSTVEDRRRGNK